MKPPETGPSAGRYEVAALVLLAACAVLFGYAALCRMVDDDEGYYALAGRAMLQGELPYRDFFLPQMPLGAFVYGVVGALCGPGLVPLRIFCALCAVLTTFVVQRTASRLAGPRAGLVATLLFALHTLVWEWAPTIKTFPLALLFGALALMLATRPKASLRHLALAGACGGLAVATRALSLPIAATVIAAPFFASEASPSGPPENIGPAWERLRRAGAALAGTITALLPVAYVALRDPAAFYFDNVAYHALRSPGDGLVKDGAQKLGAAARVLFTPLGASRPDHTGLQTTTLLVAAALAVGVARRRDGARAPLAAFAVATALLFVTNLLPSPVWVQYFTACVPPAAVLAATFWTSARVPPWAAWAYLAVYALAAVPAFHDRIVLTPSALRPVGFDGVGRALDDVTAVGARVAAHAPAYLVASQRVALPEARNQFARLFSDRLGVAERRRFHFATEQEFRDSILRSGASFVVGTGVVSETALSLRAAGFTRAVDLPGAAIWIPPGSQAH